MVGIAYFGPPSILGRVWEHIGAEVDRLFIVDLPGVVFMFENTQLTQRDCSAAG